MRKAQNTKTFGKMLRNFFWSLNCTVVRDVLLSDSFQGLICQLIQRDKIAVTAGNKHSSLAENRAHDASV